MTNNKSLSSILVRPTVTGTAVVRSPGAARMLRRRLQSALFPLIDSKYPPLTHALRLRYNVTLRQGEAELRQIGRAHV